MLECGLKLSVEFSVCKQTPAKALVNQCTGQDFVG